MWPYWVLFLLPAWMALNTSPVRDIPATDSRWSARWRWAFFGLWMMVGLRHEVGGDWGNYERNLMQASSLSLAEIMQHRFPSNDPGYALVEWLGLQWGGLYLINLIGGAIFSWGLVVFCRAQPRPWLALVVAVPYLIMVVGMGYTRQGIAVGFEMMGLVALESRRVKSFLVDIALAASFHKSAVILVPLAALVRTHNRFLTILMAAVAGLILYRTMLEDAMEKLLLNYEEAAYQSSGAAIRLAMNALPAALFLWYRRRFDLTIEQRGFWTWLSVGAWAFVGALMVMSSSTAVDRVALYWIPLQLFVWSRLPDALRLGGSKKTTVMAIVLYSLVVHFTWLNFADHSRYWIPYQFYPWVWLWE